MSEYYKALIPDELVIQELLKESQRRLNQPVDSTRLKPNLNFFQRTVNSLVSTNNRIDKSLDAVKAKTSHHKTKKIKSSYVPSVPSSLTDFTFERHINFVSASSKTTRTSRRDKSSIKSGTSKKCKKDKLKKLAKYIDEVSTDSGSDESSTHKKSDHQNQDKVSTDSDDDSHEYPHKKTYQNRDNSSKNHLIHSKSNDVILISSSDDEHSDGNAKKSSHRKKRRKD